MPHLEIEYSANLIDLDPAPALRAAVEALAGMGEYDMPTTKARIRRVDDFSVGHPDSGEAFVAITVAILPGRSDDLRQRTSRAITEAVAAVLPQRPGTQVSTEIRELASYTKVKL